MALSIFNPLLDIVFDGKNIPGALIFSLVSVLLVIVLCYIVKDIGRKNIIASAFSVIMLGVMGVVIVKILLASSKYILEFIICMMLAIITYGLLKNITKRNAYGNKIFNKLISIKRHIELQENPLLDVSLLPFVYLLKIKKEYSFLDEETRVLNEIATECMDILNSQELMKNEPPFPKHKVPSKY